MTEKVANTNKYNKNNNYNNNNNNNNENNNTGMMLRKVTKVLTMTSKSLKTMQCQQL